MGAATAMLFARNGANVVISARRQSVLDEVAAQITADGGNVITVSADISKDEDCKSLMNAAIEKFEKIDILVNNAGILDTGLAPIDKFDDEEIQKLFQLIKLVPCSVSVQFFPICQRVRQLLMLPLLQELTVAVVQHMFQLKPQL